MTISQEDLQRLLSSGPRRAHLVGVGGSGMSGVARLLAQRGHHVSGSDMGEDTDSEMFAQLGIKRFQGHAAENLGAAEFVCFSSAIPTDNPEVLEAKRRGIPIVRRARTLAAMVEPQKATVISGTHGKTTTSSMVAFILQSAGQSPSYYIGGSVANLEASASVGKGDHFVIEADESDGTMSEFKPVDLIILNIEAEHLDFYADLESIERAFEALAKSATGQVVYCLDDPAATRVGQKFKGSVGYGLRLAGPVDSGWWADDIHTTATTTTFRVWRNRELLGNVTLRVPGLHNVSNSLAALIVTLGLGVEFKVAAEALAKFTGARRRFDRLFESEEFLLVDDYAHHPSEVKATIQAARQMNRKRLMVILQPHRYSRTRALYQDFATALDGADRIFVTDIYAASETPVEGVDGKLITDAMCVAGKRDRKEVSYEPELWELKERIGREMQSGDLVLLMGAGNIKQVSRGLAAELKLYDELRRRLSPTTLLKRYEPMAKRTSMRAGGSAKLWVEPCDEEDLSRILKFCHEERQSPTRSALDKSLLKVTFVGRGTNLLVRDAGISGLTIHLGAKAFSEIRIDGDNIHVGAGARLKQVVMEAKKVDLTGLEFMEGIPGSLGGGLRMNAGAMGGSMFENVELVRVMDMEGNIREKIPSELQVGYRHCKGLDGYVVLSAILRAKKGDAKEITAKLKEYEAKRWTSQPAASSAGCIFKNPPDMSAGKLIDELGLKDLSFGKARVSEVHGNFIVNEGGATASQVLSLISIIQERVRRDRGIDLQTEVVVIGDERW